MVLGEIGNRVAVIAGGAVNGSAPAAVNGAPVRPASWLKLDAATYDLADLDKLPPPEPLIDGALDRKTITVLSGKFATYKTFVAIDMAGHLAVGKAWHGHAVPDPVKVLYIAAEGVSSIYRRAMSWQERHGDIPRGAFTVLTRPARLNQDDEMAWLADIVAKIDAGLVVVDTWHRSTPGSEENSNDDAGAAFNALATIRDDTGASFLALHHTGHEGKRARGASSLEDDADAAFVIQLAGDSEDRSPSNPRILRHRKRKDGELLNPMTLALSPVGKSVVLDVVGGVRNIQESEETRVNRLVLHASELGIPASAGHITVRKTILAETGGDIGERIARKVAESRKKFVQDVQSGTGGTAVRPLGGGAVPVPGHQAGEMNRTEAVPAAVPGSTSGNSEGTGAVSRPVPDPVPAESGEIDDHAVPASVPSNSGQIEQGSPSATVTSIDAGKTPCPGCGKPVGATYARKHSGRCRNCAEGTTP